MTERDASRGLLGWLKTLLRRLTKGQQDGEDGPAEREVDEGRLKLDQAARDMLALYTEWSNAVQALEKAQTESGHHPRVLVLGEQARLAKQSYDSKLRQHKNMASEVQAALAEKLLEEEKRGTGIDPDPERLERRYREVFVRTQQIQEANERMERASSALNDLHSDAMDLGTPQEAPPQSEAEPSASEPRQEAEPQQEAEPRQEEAPKEERQDPPTPE